MIELKPGKRASMLYFIGLICGILLSSIIFNTVLKKSNISLKGNFLFIIGYLISFAITVIIVRILRVRVIKNQTHGAVDQNISFDEIKHDKVYTNTVTLTSLVIYVGILISALIIVYHEFHQMGIET